VSLHGAVQAQGGNGKKCNVNVHPVTVIMTRQFIRHRYMSMKSLRLHHTPGSCDECRTAPDGRRPLDQAHQLEPLARL